MSFNGFSSEGRFKHQKWPRNLVLGLTYLMLYAPLVLLVWLSFHKAPYGPTNQGLSLTWYRSVLTHSTLWTAAFHSVQLAVLTASLTTAVGVLIALGLRYGFRGAKSIESLLWYSEATPDVVTGLILLGLLSCLSIPLGFFSLLLAHTIFCLPLAVQMIRMGLEGIPKPLIEAAYDLGAGEGVVLGQVLLPLLKPCLLLSWLLSFTLSIDDVGISSFVGGPGYELLPLKLYSMTKVGVSPEINALASLILLLNLTVLWLTARWFGAAVLAKMETV